jgi:hypothetical protein
MRAAGKGKPALAKPAQTKTLNPERNDPSKPPRRASTSRPPRWRPLADLQRATSPQDGGPETSEAVGIPPGEEPADQVAEARAWGDRPWGAA